MILCVLICFLERWQSSLLLIVCWRTGCCPDNYEALARLVDLMRRAGKLDEVPKFLEMAETASPRSRMEAGFSYCKGLYEWSVA